MAALGVSSRSGRQTRARLLRLAVVLGVLAVPFIAHGGVSVDDISQNVVSFVTLHIIYPVVQLLGNLLVALINIMVAVAAYNDFIHATAVEKGFIIVRDLANMFFIIVLLIIAFGTVLNIQQYRYNRLLGRLILMAFLVNYARFIAGIFIDAAQVVMLTFVNAFRQAAAGNLTTAFGIEQLLALRDSKDIGGYELVGAMLLALALVLIACIVVGVYVVVLLTRIIALWLLIILSPFAYVLRTFPAGQKYASEWWSNFSKYVVCGPVMAFFLWLSLTVVAVSNADPAKPLLKVDLNRGEIRSETGAGSGLFGDIGSGAATDISATISKISESGNLLNYMVAILLMIGSLMVAQQLCGAAGRFASEWSGKAINAAKFATGVTAAATALGVGRKKVQEGWELTKGGGRALAGYVPGRVSRWWNAKMPAFLNPKYLVEGWKQTRAEDTKLFQTRALNKGRQTAQLLQSAPLLTPWSPRQWWRYFVTGTARRNLPEVQMGFLAEQRAFAQKFKPLEKRVKAAQARKMHQLPGPIGLAQRVGMAVAAASEGHVDDIMGSRYFRDRLLHLSKNVQDPKESRRLQRMVRRGEWHSQELVNMFMYDFLGDSQEALLAMEEIGELGLQIGHPEYKGHNGADEKTGKLYANRIFGADGSVDRHARQHVVSESVAEVRKRQKQNLLGWQAFAFANPRSRQALDKDGRPMEKNGQPVEELVGGSLDSLSKRDIDKAFSGSKSTEYARRITPRVLDWLLGETKYIDKESGTLVGDRVDYARLAYMLKYQPIALAQFWAAKAEGDKKKTFQFQAYKLHRDEEGFEDGTWEKDKDGNLVKEEGMDIKIGPKEIARRLGLEFIDEAEVKDAEAAFEAAKGTTGEKSAEDKLNQLRSRRKDYANGIASVTDGWTHELGPGQGVDELVGVGDLDENGRRTNIDLRQFDDDEPVLVAPPGAVVAPAPPPTPPGTSPGGGGTPGAGPGGSGGGSGGPAGGGTPGGGTPGGGTPAGGLGSGTPGGGTPGGTPPPGGGGRKGGRRGGGRTGGGVGTAAAVAGAAAVAAASARGRGPTRPPVGGIVEGGFEEIEPGAQTVTERAAEVRDLLPGEIARLEQERQEAASAGREWEVALLETEIAERRKVVAAARTMAATRATPPVEPPAPPAPTLAAAAAAAAVPTPPPQPVAKPTEGPRSAPAQPQAEAVSSTPASAATTTPPPPPKPTPSTVVPSAPTTAAQPTQPAPQSARPAPAPATPPPAKAPAAPPPPPKAPPPPSQKAPEEEKPERLDSGDDKAEAGKPDRTIAEQLSAIETAINSGLGSLGEKLDPLDKSMDKLSVQIRDHLQKAPAATAELLNQQFSRFRSSLSGASGRGHMNDDEYGEFVRKFREFLEEFRRYSERLRKETPTPTKSRGTNEPEETSAPAPASSRRPPQPPKPPEEKSSFDQAA